MTRNRSGFGAIRMAAAVFAAALITVAGIGRGQAETAGGAAAPAAPTVEGPVAGGKGAPFLAATTFDPAEVGYGQAEFFISGKARAHRAEGALGPDGKWTALPDAEADYKTRIVVFRPLDAARFSGTVIVEWLNVSGGVDAAADWIMMHTELTRSGHAWVGVSAQQVGVSGGPAMMGAMSNPLKTVDPDRYRTLVHPGDSYSYDIFSQAGRAVRGAPGAAPDGVDPLGGLKPKAVIAAGESQSAFRLVTYVNAIHPTARVFDGFLIHSRGGKAFSAAPISQKPEPAIAAPAASRVRDDLNVPVMMFQTESDLTFLGSVDARQEDTDRFRLWEVAGTAHADAYTLVVGMSDRGDSPEAAKMVVATGGPAGISCAQPLNAGPQHFVLNAAVAALIRWVREGVAPPAAPRLEVTTDPKVAIARGPDGNALGGIRTPHVDAPIATLTGDPQPGTPMCMLFGKTTPFDEETLTRLYPTHEAYVSAFNEATDRTVKAGFILEADAALLKAAAKDAPVPK